MARIGTSGWSYDPWSGALPARTSRGRTSRGAHSPQDTAWWADRIREWEAGGHQVYAYFNNDGGGNAVRDARALRAALA